MCANTKTYILTLVPVSVFLKEAVFICANKTVTEGMGCSVYTPQFLLALKKRGKGTGLSWWGELWDLGIFAVVPDRSEEKLCEPYGLFATGPSKDAIKFSAAKWKQHNNIYSKSTSFGKEIWCGFILISLCYLREEVWNVQTAAGLLESQSGSCRRQGFRRLPHIILLAHIKEDAEVSVAVTVWLCYGDVVMWRS